MTNCAVRKIPTRYYLMRRLYSRAYRVTYSFLTTFGQHFPTIVSDTTSETSDSET